MIRPRQTDRRGEVKDPEYRRFILEHRCLLAGRTETRCVGCITGHHVKECPGAPKNDRRMIPLCEGHHLHDFGPDAIERLGRKAWEKKFRMDLEWWIRLLNEEYEHVA